MKTYESLKAMQTDITKATGRPCLLQFTHLLGKNSTGEVFQGGKVVGYWVADKMRVNASRTPFAAVSDAWCIDDSGQDKESV